ncbi:unnamed protein product [Linum tenue]|uniref:Uncharacterized protein n=1 Tax=Linum tenue TaxID=586396 RepID=A0AAV0HUC9_9ROSI|nr:unnamed protein product [Linum tenue]
MGSLDGQSWGLVFCVWASKRRRRSCNWFFLPSSNNGGDYRRGGAIEMAVGFHLPLQVGRGWIPSSSSSWSDFFLVLEISVQDE